MSCVSERRERGGRVSLISGCVIMEGWLPAWVGQDPSIPCDTLAVLTNTDLLFERRYLVQFAVQSPYSNRRRGNRQMLGTHLRADVGRQ